MPFRLPECAALARSALAVGIRTQVRFADSRPDYRELETACKRPGRRRHGQALGISIPTLRKMAKETEPSSLRISGTERLLAQAYVVSNGKSPARCLA
jgi:hypothetical protein